MRLTTYQDKAGEYRWRITARNNRIVADSSEGYTRKAAAVAAARRVVRGLQALPLKVEVLEA